MEGLLDGRNIAKTKDAYIPATQQTKTGAKEKLDPGKQEESKPQQ